MTRLVLALAALPCLGFAPAPIVLKQGLGTIQGEWRLASIDGVPMADLGISLRIEGEVLHLLGLPQICRLRVSRDRDGLRVFGLRGDGGNARTRLRIEVGSLRLALSPGDASDGEPAMSTAFVCDSMFFRRPKL